MARLFPDNNLVPPLMGPSKRLVVAEAPGQEESEQGEPLVGGSGKVFNSLLRKAGIQREQLTIINTINCRPPNNIYPTDSAARSYISSSDAGATVKHCFQNHVRPILESKNWERIDALGEKSLRLLSGKTDGILKWRGSPLPLIGTSKPIVMPTLHPAFCMRCQEYMPVVISDLTKGLDVTPENYNTTPTIDDLENFTATKFALDIETNGFTKQVICVGLCAKIGESIVVPFQGAYIKQIKRIILNAEEIITHNGVGFDMPVLCEALGIEWIPN